MKINNNLTESDIDNIDVKSQLEHQIQVQETKEPGWIFDKINSMKVSFYKTTELNGTSYVIVILIVSIQYQFLIFSQHLYFVLMITQSF